MKVALIMGSDSDLPVIQPALDTLRQFQVNCEVLVASAHRTPEVVHRFAADAADRGVKVIIAAAGAAAHLPGVVASFTALPVIGVPINSTSVGGLDALLSIVQMPAGIPVATMAINGAKNAALFALQILATGDENLDLRFKEYRADMAAEVERKNANLQAKLQQQTHTDN